MKRIVGVLILAALLLLTLGTAAAQDTSGGSPIVFSGAVEAIHGTQITVGGLVVDVSNVDAAVVTQLAAGVEVEVSGALVNGVVSAVTIVIINVPPPPTAVVTGFTVVFGGAVFDGVNTIFTYTVTGAGTPPDLSHFAVEIPTCSPALVVTAYSPAEAVSLGTDPTTGIDGIKWDLPLGVNDSRTYSVTFAGSVPTMGTVMTAVKGGPDFTTTSLPGPACTLAAVDVEKYVSADGATWLTADNAPGPVIRPGANVYFRFVVTNTGTVELSSLTLADSALDLGACVLPETLPASSVFDCVIGPLPATVGQHTNTVTATGAFATGVASDTDAAHYFGGDTGTNVPVVIIIEGPVEAININIITIYGINIELDVNSPLITVIQVGDFVRVEGGARETGDTIIIIAVTVVIVDVDIYVNDDSGAVYRDDGECANPPPPWATAVGWWRKCQVGGEPVLPPGQERKNRDDD